MLSVVKCPFVRVAAPVFLLFAACTTPQAPASRAVSDVRAVWDAQVAAWNRGDLDGYMAAYWNSPDLVFFSNGGETRGWQATLERYRTRYQSGGKQMGALDFPQLDFTALGPQAVLARGRWHLRMPVGQELSGMTTVIFRELPEGWRIVHDHSTSEGR
jgi:beta-aspartyl-peptidase (threonine type)